MLTRGSGRKRLLVGPYEVLCGIGFACSTGLWLTSNFIGWRYIDDWDHAQIWLNRVVGFGFGGLSVILFAGAVDRRRQGRRSPVFGVAVVSFIATAVALAASLNHWV